MGGRQDGCRSKMIEKEKEWEGNEREVWDKVKQGRSNDQTLQMEGMWGSLSEDQNKRVMELSQKQWNEMGNQEIWERWDWWRHQERGKRDGWNEDLREEGSGMKKQGSGKRGLFKTYQRSESIKHAITKRLNGIWVQFCVEEMMDGVEENKREGRWKREDKEWRLLKRPDGREARLFE